MTAIADEVRVHPGLLEWLEEHDVRYELIDGMVVVSPPPGMPHERRFGPVFNALFTAAPAHLEVFGPGLELHYAGRSYVMPDVSVARREDADRDEDGLYAPPLLVVELLSPCTLRKDLLLKRDIYAEFGVPSYWLVDPVARVLTVLTLREGAYEETARGSRLELTEPYAVTIDLAA